MSPSLSISPNRFIMKMEFNSELKEPEVPDGCLSPTGHRLYFLQLIPYRAFVCSLFAVCCSRTCQGQHVLKEDRGITLCLYTGSNNKKEPMKNAAMRSDVSCSAPGYLQKQLCYISMTSRS